MTERRPIRIVIVDDHPAVRAGLAAMLGSKPQFEVVAEAGNAAEAVAACDRCQPDVVLMDLRIPGGGVEATIGIRSRWLEMRIIIITTFDGDEDIYRAIQSGANGYLLKGLTRDELSAAVEAVLTGTMVMPPDLAGRLSERVIRKDLSPRELEILSLIVGGLSNKEIAHELRLGDESVKSYLKNLFRKLGVADRTQAAVEAIRHGIVHLDW